MTARRLALAAAVAAAAWLALAPAGAQTADAARTPGEVTKIDKAGGRLTLKHGEIKSLEMPPMTMVFRVADPRWLDSLNVGDRVMFTAEKINGQFTVTSVGKAP